jgi:alpha-L-fucosidase
MAVLLPLILLVQLGVEAQRNPFVFPNVEGINLFKQARLGLFVHWGPISQWGDEISFPLTCTSFPCYVQSVDRTTLVVNNASELSAHRQAYASLARTFNPVNFNASLLSELASSAGFGYLTWVATHCDGYSNWNSTENKNYSIVTSPYGQDTFLAMAESFRSKGLRVGAYVCPSFWNRDDYFYPDALTSFGTCCQPNYLPSEVPSAWTSFVSYLHSQLVELTQKYEVSHFWIDSGTYPPAVDTNIESIMATLRSLNPELVIQVRDGGLFHDYVESTDHSEDDAHDLMGMSYFYPASVSKVWEVPGTLGEQWAYDPTAVYKDANTVIRSLVGVIAKGGNYLLNIGLDPTGVWAPEAITTLQNMSNWMKFNHEAVNNVTLAFPYEYFHGPLESDGGLVMTSYYSASLLRDSTYVYLVDDRSAVITETTNIILPHFKTTLLSTLPVAVSYLSPTGLVELDYSIESVGLVFPVKSIIQPLPVSLGTYYHNYSMVDEFHVKARSNRKAEWPQVWFKASNKTELMKHQATGFSSSPRPYVDVKSDASAVVDNAPCGTRACDVYVKAGYSFVRDEGTCYRSSFLPGNEAAVPIYLYYNGQNDNMASVTAPNDGQQWQQVDLECWIYATDSTGTRNALEVWHSSTLNDYWTLASAQSRAQAQAAGYTLYSSLGFVDSNQPPNEMDTAASYAYVLRIDWS